MSAHLDSTIGASFIGMVVAAILYGGTWRISFHAFYYYTHQNDGWYLKLLVTAVVIFDTAHQAIITHTIYMYTLTDWGNIDKLQLILWSSWVEIIFIGLTAVIVQSFLTLRIWRLSNGNIYVTGTSAILVLGGFITIIIYIARVVKFETLIELEQVKAESISVDILGAAANVFITASLCSLLYVSRTGYRSDAIINRLILFTVNTGLLTSLCAVASLISVLASPDTFVYVVFFYCLGRLYANTLLASLNARKTISRLFNESSAGTTAVSVTSPVFKNSLTQCGTVSVRTDTITQEYHPDYDQKPQGASSEENATVNNPQALP